MALLIIVIIILAVQLRKKNKELDEKESEIRILKQKIEEMKVGEISSSVMPSNNDLEQKDLKNMEVKFEGTVPKGTKVAFEKQTKTNSKTSEVSEKERKDIAILVTGAICIVLAAVVFLISTWNTIPDILKTAVLALVTAVFFGASYMAKQKYNLDKVSQTFFYIAMAYIPICLFSISAFGLLGEYLSIYGEGRYVYFAIASIAVAVIYYFTYSTKKNCYLLYGSALTQMFAIISFSLIVSDNIALIGVNLLLYNIILMQLTKDEIFIKVYNFIPAVVALFGFWQMFTKIGLVAFMLFLLAVNFLMLETKKSRKAYGFMFHIFAVAFGLYVFKIYNDELGEFIAHSLMLIYVTGLYMLELIALNKNEEKKNFLKTSAIITVCTLALLQVEVALADSTVKPYVVAIVQTVVLAFTYKGSGSKGKVITGILMPCYFASAGMVLIDELEGTDTAYIVFAVVIFALSEIFRNKDEVPYYVSKIISFGIIYTTGFEDNLTTIIIVMILAIIMIAQNVKEKSDMKSIIPLICVFPAVFLNRLDMDVRLALMTVLTIGVSFISIIRQEVSLYTIASFIYMCFTIDRVKNDYIKEIIYIIWTTAHFVQLIPEKQKDVFKFLTGFGGLFLYNTLVEDMGLDSYTIFIMLGWVTLAIYTFRGILIKYRNTDKPEYFVFAVIYLGALCNYVDEIDGMIFMVLVLGVMILSYLKKYGAIFMVSMYAILVNVLVLTREFWFSIPWWLYLLAIGAVLIAFGTRNELEDKKPKAIEKLKNIKNNIDAGVKK